jgi:hypothetical protein
MASTPSLKASVRFVSLTPALLRIPGDTGRHTILT